MRRIVDLLPLDAAVYETLRVPAHQNSNFPAQYRLRIPWIAIKEVLCWEFTRVYGLATTTKFFSAYGPEVCVVRCCGIFAKSDYTKTLGPTRYSPRRNRNYSYPKSYKTFESLPEIHKVKSITN